MVFCLVGVWRSVRDSSWQGVSTGIRTAGHSGLRWSEAKGLAGFVSGWRLRVLFGLWVVSDCCKDGGAVDVLVFDGLRVRWWKQILFSDWFFLYETLLYWIWPFGYSLSLVRSSNSSVDLYSSVLFLYSLLFMAFVEELRGGTDWVGVVCQWFGWRSNMGFGSKNGFMIVQCKGWLLCSRAVVCPDYDTHIHTLNVCLINLKFKS